ncbi:uncharacterized protein BO88DRAFT_447317 [Aspergillus vadensis CBS 113365]|uniref:Mid2 domain-containing protein n=1 Tax=Aspergillus vadensis (strain CBS 113365 / IMI 142717 / IBT 24658) TaxID=1448311 RepID=A0A319BD47_ASPVC|nr:hypothetical protein BO88DRAFT_447317 [Aspergillus vadensis CBS 113365]PYH63943.1 hypothetical protein BO88DRAFT_447317 [Aspergillus vadensis CBS 113365]
MKNGLGSSWTLLSNYLSLAAAVTCYTPDGTLVVNSLYQLCIPISDIHSMCCRLNGTIRIQELWCRGSSTSCCNTHEISSLGPTPVGTDPNSSVTATAAPTTTVTAIPTEDSSKNKDESERLTKVAIGVAVGVPLACIAVGMYGAGYLLGRRSTQKILSPAKFEPRAMSIPLKKPKGEIGRPRRSDDAASM